jgi:cell division protein ZapA (FtsZ GTPase activity inhibitor)
MASSNKVTVTIYGKEYIINGAKPRDYIIKIADHVNEVMTKIAGDMGGGAPSDVAVLAALNAADDYYSYMNRHDESDKEKEQMQKDIEHYTRMWEEAKKNFLQYKTETKSALEKKDKLQQKLNEIAIENDNLLKATIAKDSKIEELEDKISALNLKLKSKDESGAIVDEQHQKLEDTYKELEGNYFELQMENIQLKGEVERIKKQME